MPVPPGPLTLTVLTADALKQAHTYQVITRHRVYEIHAASLQCACAIVDGRASTCGTPDTQPPGASLAGREEGPR